MRPKIKRWVWNLLLALDQLANAALGGFPDETFSARCWRKGALARQWFWDFLRVFIDVIFWPAEKNHCRKSYENEKRRDHGPAELRIPDA